MLREWHTDRVLLRQLGPRSARRVQEYGLRSREFLEPWEPRRAADFWQRRTVADRLALEISQSAADQGLALYLSVPQDPDRVIGRIAVSNVVRGAFQSCTVGYALAPDALGQGFMTEALFMMTGIVFEQLGLHRIEANVIPRNVASLGLVKRCGFREEGTALRYLYINGAWEDHIRFARTREEWHPSPEIEDR